MISSAKFISLADSRRYKFCEIYIARSRLAQVFTASAAAAQQYVCMHVCMYACMYVCMYVCINVRMYMSVDEYVYMYVCMYVCMYE